MMWGARLGTCLLLLGTAPCALAQDGRTVKPTKERRAILDAIRPLAVARVHQPVAPLQRVHGSDRGGVIHSGRLVEVGFRFLGQRCQGSSPLRLIEGDELTLVGELGGVVAGCRLLGVLLHKARGERRHGAWRYLLNHHVLGGNQVPDLPVDVVAGGMRPAKKLGVGQIFQITERNELARIQADLDGFTRIHAIPPRM